MGWQRGWYAQGPDVGAGSPIGEVRSAPGHERHPFHFRSRTGANGQRCRNVGVRRRNAARRWTDDRSGRDFIAAAIGVRGVRGVRGVLGVVVPLSISYARSDDASIGERGATNAGAHAGPAIPHSDSANSRATGNNAGAYGASAPDGRLAGHHQ